MHSFLGERIITINEVSVIMGNVFLSVVIPVYNVEEYLSRCVNSFLNQRTSETELLLIDDGSTDDSGKICDRYSEQYKHIKAYHKPNGGLGDARNYGIDITLGSVCLLLRSF